MLFLNQPTTFFSDKAKAEKLVNTFNNQAEDLFELYKLEERGNLFVISLYDDVGLVGTL